MKPNKSDQFFAETILRQYQERMGETNETIKIFAEVFRKSVAITMQEFRKSYHEIFAELPRKNFEEFCKMIFEKDQKSLLEQTTIPPCLVKDFYDEYLDEIKSGGRSANIIRTLGSLIDEEKEEELAFLAESWGIAEPEQRIMGKIHSVRHLKCSSIPNSPIDFDKRVFTELLRENLPELIFYLEIKLGFRPPLRDITNEEKAALGLKWADKVKTVRFAEDAKLLSDASGDLAAKEASNMLQGVIVHGEGKIAEPKVRK